MRTIIFSIGAIGRLFYRKFKDDNNYDIVGFVDNNSQLKGTSYDNHPIYTVEDIIDLDYDQVLIGGVHYVAMKEQLENLGVKKEKIIMIDDTDITYSDDIRAEKTDEIVRAFCKIMEEANIKYYLIASSLLSLLRGHNLSKVSDVDVMLDSKEDLEKVCKLFKKEEEKLNISVTGYLVEEGTSFLDVGDYSFVTIASTCNPIESEPAMLDVNILFNSDSHRFYRLGDKYIYFDKKYFEDRVYLEYKDMKIPAPIEYDQYLKETYGEGYIVPPAKWSEDDFITLVSEDELLKVLGN
jgi:phosphorylcholine metabolism protein LicD